MESPPDRAVLLTLAGSSAGAVGELLEAGHPPLTVPGPHVAHLDTMRDAHNGTAARLASLHYADGTAADGPAESEYIPPRRETVAAGNRTRRQKFLAADPPGLNAGTIPTLECTVLAAGTAAAHPRADGAGLRDEVCESSRGPEATIEFAVPMSAPLACTCMRVCGTVSTGATAREAPASRGARRLGDRGSPEG